MAKVKLTRELINAIVRQHKAGDDESSIAEALGTKVHVVHEVLTSKEQLARPVPAARKARADAVIAYWLGKTSTIGVARYVAPKNDAETEATTEEASPEETTATTEETTPAAVAA